MTMVSAADIKAKFEKYVRVLKITKKPDIDEFSASLKITGIGILIIGAIGFIVYLVAYYSGVFG